MEYLIALFTRVVRQVRPDARILIVATALLAPGNFARAALDGPCFTGCAGQAATDTDGDGLTDCVEYCLGTDTSLSDSDADGLPDAFEVDNGFNPLNAADAGLDSDNDLLTNLEEYLDGSSPMGASSPRQLRFVSPGGSDAGGTGAPDQPYRTIAFALTIASGAGPQNSAIVLMPGLYEEDVQLLPGLLLRGLGRNCDELNFGSCPTIRGRIFGAAGSTLEYLTLTNSDFGDVLLSMDGVAMRVRGVAFIGSDDRLSIGVQCKGEAPRNSTFFNCYFFSLDTGLDIFGTIPQVLFSDFDYCAITQIMLHETTLPNANPSGLGDATRSNLGWNRFLGEADDMVLINDRPESIKIERDEWNMEDPVAIQGRMAGPADFEPFLPVGEALLAGAIFLNVQDGSTQNPVTTATVNVSPSDVTALTENTNGLYAFPVLPEGNYDIEVTAPGFRTASLDVNLLRGDTKSFLVPLEKAADQPGPENCRRSTGRKWPSAGDTLVGLLLFAGFRYVKSRR